MTEEEKNKLEEIKWETRKEIRALQPRILRVGTYLSGLQYRLGELMSEYHQADRALADHYKKIICEGKKKKPDTIEEILKDPIKAAKLFEQLRKMTNDEVMETLSSEGD